MREVAPSLQRKLQPAFGETMGKLLWTAATAAMFALSAPAAAAEVIWFDSDHTLYSGNYSAGTPLLFSGGGVDVQASAWSIHSDGNIYQAQLGVWSGGLGVTNGSGDNSHTIDNSGFLDFVLLQFSEVVELENARLNTGWHGMNDTDATLGYTVTAMPYTSVLNLGGAPATQLAALNLYGSGGAGNSGNSYRDVNPSDYVGNLWLLSASFDNPEGSRKLDGFKLEKLTFSAAPSIP